MVLFRLLGDYANVRLLSNECMTSVHLNNLPQDYPAFSYPIIVAGLCLSFTQFVSQFRLWLKQVGVCDNTLYSTHSFRRGGATFAFKCGVSPNLIKSQVDWASDCYRKYIALSISDKLETTKKMSDSIVKLHL